MFGIVCAMENYFTVGNAQHEIEKYRATFLFILAIANV